MPDDAEQVRASVVSRYGRLAEAAAAGRQVTDFESGETCFGAAAYNDAGGLPEGATNAEFLIGSIEDIPLPEAHVDAVISNCVINLSADKPPRTQASRKA